MDEMLIEKGEVENKNNMKNWKNGEKCSLIVPDGGWGWLVLGGSTLVNLLIPGSIKSFGVLFVDFIHVFHLNEVTASAIPAICYFLYSSLGPLAAVLSKRLSYRAVTIIGGTFASLGMILSFFATSVLHLCFTYGVLVGCGAGLSFPPGIFIVTSYFDKYRGFANGVAISGSAFGSILLPPLLQYLSQQYGVNGAVLIMGALTMNVWVGALLYHPVEWHMRKVKPDSPTSLSPDENLPKEIDRVLEHETVTPNIKLGAKLDRTNILSSQSTLARSQLELFVPAEKCVSSTIHTKESNRTFILILISNASTAISFTNFTIFLPSYAISLSFDKSQSSWLLSVVATFDLVGRIGAATISDILPIRKLYYYTFGLLLSGLALLVMPLFDKYILFCITCALFGLFSGTYTGTTVVAMLELLGPDKLSSSYTLSLFINGILQLVGPPICSFLHRQVFHSFDIIIYALGIIVMLGSTLPLFILFNSPISHSV